MVFIAYLVTVHGLLTRKLESLCARITEGMSQ
jgi:hypothetical protein